MKEEQRQKEEGEASTGCQLNQLRAYLTKNFPQGYVTGCAVRTETTQELLSLPSYVYDPCLNHRQQLLYSGAE